MSEEKITPAGETLDPSRRKFFSTAAFAGLAGAGLSVGLSACKQEQAPAPAAAPAAHPAADASEVGKYEVAPGQLDTYYSFSSGGHSGNVRVYGLSSGRELKCIPVFNTDCLVGWGITNESKAIIGTKPDGSLTNGMIAIAASPLIRFMPASAITRSPLDFTSACQVACNSAAASSAAATLSSMPSFESL